MYCPAAFEVVASGARTLSFFKCGSQPTIVHSASMCFIKKKAAYYLSCLWFSLIYGLLYALFYVLSDGLFFAYYMLPVIKNNSKNSYIIVDRT